MSRLDWIAVGPLGAYALMDAQYASKAKVSAFKARATRRGHRTELVSVDEACRRHLEYLARCDRIRAAAAAEAVSPSAGQMELFEGAMR